MNETEENKDLKLSILADLCLPYAKLVPAKLVPAKQNGLKLLTPYNLISTKQCV